MRAALGNDAPAPASRMSFTSRSALSSGPRLMIPPCAYPVLDSCGSGSRVMTVM
jgi:hypothetical protein